MAFDHSRRRWFGTCPCRPVPRGLPSSVKQLRTTRPYGLSRSWRTFADHPYLQASLGPSDIVLDHTVTIEPEIPPEKWAEFYLTALNNLKPGVTEFVIHPGYDDDELRAATRERSTWGSAWRQRDYDFFTSDQFREVLAQQNVKLITWRELAHAAEAK